MQTTTWTVQMSSRIAKNISLLPEQARLKMMALMSDLEKIGPSVNWPHYGKLGTDSYHCHIKRGRPTYVVCWRVISKNEKIIEVYYAGTHENAPY